MRLARSQSGRMTGLWRHPDFVKLWFGTTVSEFGSQITVFVLPLLAILLLNASPIQVGLLAAAGTAPSLLVGLFPGPWVDHHRRRPLLIVCDMGRAAVLLAVPVAALLGRLNLPLLLAVTFVHGVLTVYFDVAYGAYLPGLVSREALVEGNSKLEVSRTAAQIAGPGLAGGLAQVLFPPLTILFDCLSFACSALAIGGIRTPEQTPTPRQATQSALDEIGEGIRFISGHPLLRAITTCSGVVAFFKMMMFAVLTLYALRELHLAVGILGLALALGNVGWLVGALVSPRVVNWLGIGRAILFARVIGGVGGVLVALAAGSPLLAVSLLMSGMALDGVSALIYSIGVVSVRQAVTPDTLRGRVTATARFVSAGVLPLGSVVGGALGATIGLHETLWLSTIGEAIAFIIVARSPLGRLHSVHLQPQAAAANPVHE